MAMAFTESLFCQKFEPASWESGLFWRILADCGPAKCKK
jgi:hypothetical protein